MGLARARKLTNSHTTEPCCRLSTSTCQRGCTRQVYANKWELRQREVQSDVVAKRMGWTTVFGYSLHYFMKKRCPTPPITTTIVAWKQWHVQLELRYIYAGWLAWQATYVSCGILRRFLTSKDMSIVMCMCASSSFSFGVMCPATNMKWKCSCSFRYVSFFILICWSLSRRKTLK
jgi:hypothetical protein